MRFWKVGIRVALWSTIISLTAITCYRISPRLIPVAEEDTPPELYIEFSEPVKDFLRTEWDKRAKEVAQVERGYCLSFTTQVDENDNNEEYYYVTKVKDAQLTGPSSPVNTRFICPKGSVALHTHPPTTCTDMTELFGVYFWKAKNCQLGGRLAFQCQPSPTDRDTLYEDWIEQGDLFSIVQCDRNSLVPYYPH
jgi:hypothetical protein